MVFKDYYKILEISRNADETEIKKAYRKLAMQYHPDRNQGDKKSEEKFKEIAEAYAVLSDDAKRTKFESFMGSKAKASQKKTTRKKTTRKKSTKKASQKTTQKKTTREDIFEEAYEDVSSGKYDDSFSDFFNQIFNKKNKHSKSTVGEDVRGKITIDLQEVYDGSSRILTINGEKLRLKIKPGIRNEQILKISGHGKVSETKGERGDLYIRIVIADNPYYQIDGVDLHREAYIDIFTAMTGGKVKLQAPKGEVTIDIPAAIEYGKSLRLKGMGMPDYDNHEILGDLYLSLKYKIPNNLTKYDHQILKKLQKTRSRRKK